MTPAVEKLLEETRQARMIIHYALCGEKDLLADLCPRSLCNNLTKAISAVEAEEREGKDGKG